VPEGRHRTVADKERAMQNTFYFRIVTAGLAACLALIGPTVTTPASAAVIVVDTTSDELNSDFDCSLREAIESANLDTAIDNCLAGEGVDRIILPPGTYTLEIEGREEDENATGDLDILDDLFLLGDNAEPLSVILDGMNTDRLLDVHPGVRASIQGVTIFQGDSGSNGGGLRNLGLTSLSQSIIQGNLGLRFGGGIINEAGAILLVTDSTIANNRLVEIDGTGGGGGISNNGFARVTRTTITNNIAARGGGIYNIFGDLTLANSTVSGNEGLNGGAIFSLGSLVVGYSTITGNVATDAVGGIWGFDLTDVLLTRSILSGNQNPGSDLDCGGIIDSRGGNVVGNTSGCYFLAGDNDLLNADPLLGPLTDNGGRTETHALLPGSPAIDLVGLDSCSIDLDQRGFVRPVAAGCDAGAVEQE